MPEFFTEEIHNCQFKRGGILVAPPDINQGKGISPWKFRILRNRKRGYTLILCKRCNQTVAAVC